jgi:hypothetical protein
MRMQAGQASSHAAADAGKLPNPRMPTRKRPVGALMPRLDSLACLRRKNHHRLSFLCPRCLVDGQQQKGAADRTLGERTRCPAPLEAMRATVSGCRRRRGFDTGGAE